ncbi:exodeoxyribonuclease VII small subunit [Natroniella sulfidigena]|uniref:exodeoxyribonuclease VII small subunit n=1 Tax=Natroniella sulfidigena TaxID=723921 RepID=UPI00200B4D67|nr:exodeoxyribonuclease VII small subunit [Natroniella sulfidigena]MCK8817523.1 exodeoxyribonuclease VII small subunit [Natroniella sulfidigena]
MSTEAELSFEEALEQLEDIVGELERGELSLAESLGKFETGIKLTKFCSQKLEQAEGKIEVIKEEAGEIKTEIYDNY